MKFLSYLFSVFTTIFFCSPSNSTNLYTIGNNNSYDIEILNQDISETITNEIYRLVREKDSNIFHSGPFLDFFEWALREPSNAKKVLQLLGATASTKLLVHSLLPSMKAALINDANLVNLTAVTILLGCVETLTDNGGQYLFEEAYKIENILNFELFEHDWRDTYLYAFSDFAATSISAAKISQKSFNDFKDKLDSTMYIPSLSSSHLTSDTFDELIDSYCKDHEEYSDHDIKNNIFSVSISNTKMWLYLINSESFERSQIAKVNQDLLTGRYVATVRYLSREIESRDDLLEARAMEIMISCFIYPLLRDMGYLNKVDISTYKKISDILNNCVRLLNDIGGLCLLDDQEIDSAFQKIQSCCADKQDLSSIKDFFKNDDPDRADSNLHRLGKDSAFGETNLCFPWTAMDSQSKEMTDLFNKISTVEDLINLIKEETKFFSSKYSYYMDEIDSNKELINSSICPDFTDLMKNIIAFHIKLYTKTYKNITGEFSVLYRE